jgi:clan AA aspartic protease (TIGR02281 family)
MKNLVATLCLTIAVLLGSVGVSSAADFNTGLDAYMRDDYATALREWTPLAEQGDAQAQHNLGWMYDNGQGVAQDYLEAELLYRQAAAQGLADAQANLGFMYANGQGVAQDDVEAVRWWRLAAEQGIAEAQRGLGFMYANGRGVAQDHAEAERLYLLAATQGDAPAQANLVALRQNRASQAPAGQQGAVTMVEEGGVFAVPVLINDTITLNFIVDSGASGVSIPEDVVSTLVRSGTITDADFTGTQTFVLADGSTTTEPTFNIRSLKVGDITLENIEGSVADAQGLLLLGQSFLGRFNSWSIDNSNHTLVLE